MTDENIKSEDVVADPIVRPVGERVVIVGGHDYCEPTVRIVPNTYEHAGDDEKAIHITQGPGMGVSISFSTLQAILNWASGG